MRSTFQDDSLTVAKADTEDQVINKTVAWLRNGLRSLNKEITPEIPIETNVNWVKGERILTCKLVTGTEIKFEIRN